MEFNNGLTVCWGNYDNGTIMVDFCRELELAITFNQIYSVFAFAYRLNNVSNARCVHTTCIAVTNSSLNLGWFREDGGAQCISWMCIGF